MNRGFTLIELLIVIAILVVVTVACMGGIAGDWYYDTPIEGRVASAQQNHQYRGNNNGETKIGVFLSPANIMDGDERFAELMVDNELAIDCGSTRCAALANATWVKMNCRLNFRWIEPNVIECKLGHATSKAPSWAKEAVEPPAPEVHEGVKPLSNEEERAVRDGEAEVFVMDAESFGNEG